MPLQTLLPQGGMGSVSSCRVCFEISMGFLVCVWVVWRAAVCPGPTAASCTTQQAGAQESMQWGCQARPAPQPILMLCFLSVCVSVFQQATVCAASWCGWSVPAGWVGVVHAAGFLGAFQCPWHSRPLHCLTRGVLETDLWLLDRRAAFSYPLRPLCAWGPHFRPSVDMHAAH